MRRRICKLQPHCLHQSIRKKKNTIRCTPNFADMAKPLGFTLIEILIALFIFSVISMLITVALNSLLRSQSSVSKSADRLADVQTSLLLFSRDIKQTVDRPASVPAGHTIAFIGAPDSLIITHMGLMNPESLLQRSTLQRTQYQYTKGNLVRLTWPLPDSPPQTIPSSRTLLHSLTQLSFSYLDQKKHFHRYWPVKGEESNTLPRAVRIVMYLQGMGMIDQLYPIQGQTIETKP